MTPEQKIDLQDQVRNHIKAHDLFDWHEALTEEEMMYLENLLLTFAPMFYPGSIGFNQTVQPYLSAGLEREKELEEALRYLVNDVRNKPNDTRYATALKKANDVLNK